MKISAVISAYNEEKKIEACLASIAFVDEIIVVDNSSTDKTAAIANKFTKYIYTQKNNPMLNVNKNYGFSKAKGEWILAIDADERVPDELKNEILQIIKKDSQIAGYWIPRKNIIFGKWIQSEMWWPDYQLRLFKKEKGRFPSQHVHEYVSVDGPTEKLQKPLIHENYSSISQFLYKMDKIYTENEVAQFLANKKTIHWTNAITFPASDFIKTFFSQKGYKDGLHGLVLSMLQASYSLVVFAKIWEKQGFKEYNSENFAKDVFSVFKKKYQELSYWIFTVLLNREKNLVKKGIYKIMRKISQMNLNRE